MGLIGLGNMGSAFAERLLDAGFDLSVHNRTPAKAEPLAERGATIAETAFDLAGRSRRRSHLPFRRRRLRIGRGIRHRRSSTGHRARRHEHGLAGGFRASRRARRAGSASSTCARPSAAIPASCAPETSRFIVSGPRAAFERVEPVLRAIGPTIHVVGDAEQARVVKLAINLVIAGSRS